MFYQCDECNKDFDVKKLIACGSMLIDASLSFQAEEVGVPASVELCVKALQLPKQDDSEPRISVCKTVSCLLPDDLEVLRASLLTEFLLGPCQEVFGCLEELYLRPDQKYDQENEVIPNSLRCELLLALKAYWPFDPEFWDWKTLKYHCLSLLGLLPESEGEEEEVVDKLEKDKKPETQGITVKVEYEQKTINGSLDGHEQQDKTEASSSTEGQGESQTNKHKLCCQICKRTVSDTQIIHHSKRHAEFNCHPCPVCMEKFKSRKELVPHMKNHVQSQTHVHTNNVKSEDVQKQRDEDDEMEPGEITIDPSLMLYYKSTHDPDVLHHIVQQAKTVKDKHTDDDEHITFEYIDQHFKLQNRDEYPCPGTGCTRTFKHSKYLYVHLKSEHKGDENVKHFQQMRDKREKCVFCRRHFVSAYHHRKHRRVHYGDRPYACVVVGCGAQFSTSNELVTHKQTHGYQLNYQCELEGCYVTYSDLGQIYHHEAQHFRDAAFTCFSEECRKYYLSKKEFKKHLSTHNITLSEEDFEAQRKAKQKLFKTEVAPPLTKSVNTEEIVSEEVLNSSSGSCNSPSQAFNGKEPKATMTLVAVCFDGSKFTCGFEKCGMTFSRARDVQRHLKCAHPEHLKLENKEHKHSKEWCSKSKGVKSNTEPDIEHKGQNDLSAQSPPVKSGKDRKPSTQPKNTETSTSSLPTNDALKEIVVGLSKLDLNSSPPHSVPNGVPQSSLETNAPQVSLHHTTTAMPPFAMLQKRPPQQPEERVKVKTEEASVADDQCAVESLANAKPYICEVKGCGFRTAQSYSLLRHYNTKHGRTVEQAKRLTSLKTTSFKPYVCHLCSKSHREKHVLRAHYIQTHNMSESLVDKISCPSVRHEGSSDATKHTPQHVTSNDPKIRKEIPNVEHEPEKKNSNLKTEGAQNSDHHSPSEEEGEDEPESREEGAEQKVQSDDSAIQQVRTRRLVAKSNLCYILDKFSKPFHCVAKNCDAAFSTQGGLVRHLQLVHHYNRSQLLLEQDVDEPHSPESKKEPAKKRPLPNSDEPQPQYKCHFANCNASYHLKSSLVRHTRDCHSQPPELIRCKYEGCTRVFSHDEALKNHMLYSHCEYYNSLVVRLQSTHKKSVTGCQKKLIVTPQSPQKEEPGSATTQEERSSPEPEVPAKPEETGGEAAVEQQVAEEKKSKRNCFSRYVFRSHEEALQMCQDRCLRVAYPCMVQDCDSVVTYMGSLHRHYLKVHRMRREDLVKNDDKLVFNAEQLEELIQRKSARPTVTGASTPNGVHKMEYQAEPENTGEQPAPMSLHSIKTEAQDEDNHDPLGFPEEEEKEPPPVERNGVLVGADEVLYGEPSTGGHTEDSAAAMQNSQKPEERLSWEKIKPLLRPVTVDLSPPCSLRFATEEGFQDVSSTKDGGKVLNGSALPPAPPVRQPLKRKNELSEQPPNLKDTPPRSPSPPPFDITAYKPIGFESSFLRFIQETTPKDKIPSPVKRRDSFRRSCSVKENNQLGISHTRSRRTHSPLLKPHAMTGDFTSVQNLKSILDKALAGCGDLAIKQLQYLRPVVVLERPVCTTITSNLFPSDTNKSELLLGS